MEMFLEIFLIIIVVLILIGFFVYYADVLISPSNQSMLLGSVCVNNKCFQVELAETSAQRDKGLMYREKLDKDKGMLFIFDKEAVYPFWMKNTLIPLDIIWADSNGKVVFIGQNVQPCLPAGRQVKLICPSVYPNVKAKYVLEINAGISEEIGVKLGDQLKIPQ